MKGTSGVAAADGTKKNLMDIVVDVVVVVVVVVVLLFFVVLLFLLLLLLLLKIETISKCSDEFDDSVQVIIIVLLL